MRFTIRLISYLTAYNNNIFPNNYYQPINKWSPLKANRENYETSGENFNETISNKTKKHPQQDKYDEVLKNPCINFRAVFR